VRRSHETPLPTGVGPLALPLDTPASYEYI
jgi:hypothetical protein